MTRPAATPDDLQSPDPNIRLRGLSALVETPEMRSLLKQLFEIARRDRDDRVKYAAMELYGKVRELMDGSRVMGASLETADGRLDEQMVQRLLEHGRPDAKIDTLRVLAARNLTAAAPLLRSRLPAEDDPWVLATMVKALAALGGPEDVGHLSPRLSHFDPRVRANTAEALGMLGTSEALAAVRPHLSSPDPRMRGIAALVMMAESPAEALDTLQAMAMSSDDAQREAALYRFAKLRHGATRVILARMASREEDSTRLERIHELLESRRAVGALSHLAEEADDEALQSSLRARIDSVALELGLTDEDLEKATTRFRTDSESSGLSEIEDIELGDEDDSEILTRSAVYWGREGGEIGEIARQAREGARGLEQAQADAIRQEERRRFGLTAGIAVTASLCLGLYLGPDTPQLPGQGSPAATSSAASPEVHAQLVRVIDEAGRTPTDPSNFQARCAVLMKWLQHPPAGTKPPLTLAQLLELQGRHEKGDAAAATELQRWLEKVGAESLGTPGGS
jgi:HEAT repeat protein